MATKKPCEMLKALRQRAGLSGRECAKALGSDAQTTYFRYEDQARMADRLIPWAKIELLARLMVGKGTPPIALDELVAISDARNFGKAGTRGGLHASISESGPGAAPVARTAGELVGAGIPLRFRAERGVYIDMGVLETRSHGPSPVAAMSDWAPDRQFAVMVGDAHAMPRAPAGVVLHCVSGLNPMGRLVVLAVEKAHLGIAEVVVGTFVDIEDGKVRADIGMGAAVVGRLLGAVVGRYTRD